MFKANIQKIYGEKGKRWLDNLPIQIEQAEATYGLSNLRPVNNLSYNYVLIGFQGSQPVILKLGLDFDGFKREAEALKSFSGFSAVKIFTEEAGLLLLERAVPGISLKSYFPEKDDEAISITANLIQQLHKAPIPNAHAFPHIKDWLSALDSDLNLPVRMLEKVREIRDRLLKTSGPDVLLHGDLHHDNILQNGDDWVVIDPKGVIGEEAFEVAAFIRNPIPELLTHSNAIDIIHHRIARSAQMLELPSQRIYDWCFVQAVLALVWANENGCETDYFEQLVDIFDAAI